MNRQDEARKENARLYRMGLTDIKGFSKETSEEFIARRKKERAAKRKAERRAQALREAQREKKVDVMAESEGSTASKLRKSRQMGGAKTILDLIKGK